MLDLHRPSIKRVTLKKLKTIPKFVGCHSRRNKTKNAINKANKTAAAAARKTKNLKSNTE